MVLPAIAGVLDDVKSKGQLVESTDANYAPQSFLDEKGQLVGFDIDVAKEVARRLGVTAKFVTPDWDIIVSGKWGGRWDLSIGSMTITAERAQVNVGKLLSPSILKYDNVFIQTSAELSRGPQDLVLSEHC